MALDIKKANKTYEFSNLSVSKILVSKAVGKEIPEYGNQGLAKAAGLAKGDLFHVSGALQVVV